MSEKPPLPPEQQPTPNLPPKEDPWEARERERARWQRGGGGKAVDRRPQASRGRQSASHPVTTGSATQETGVGDSGFREDVVAWGMIATLAVLLFSEVPRIAAVERETLVRIGTGALLLLIGSAREFQDRLPVALRRGPNPAILLLFGWSIFEFFHAPFRSYATTDLTRVFDGVGAYFLCAYCLRAPRQTGLLAAGLLFLGCVVALLDLSHSGEGNFNASNWFLMERSVLGTHENVGSFLMLLFPVSLAFAISASVEEKRRLTAIASSLVIGADLLIARPRSAWIGSVFALLFLAVAYHRFLSDGGASATRASEAGHHRSRRRKSRLASLLGSPAIVIAAAVIVFLFFAGAAPMVLGRARSMRSFAHDVSFTGREQVWAGGARMASERSVLGWGLGTFQVLQGRWTHFGTEIPQALAKGVGDENMAHDYYIQWAVDTGGVGLFLYVLVIAVFLASAWRSIPNVIAPIPQALICGCVAAVTAGAVDAVASPAYYFHGISTLYWCLIGLGMASMRPSGKRAGAAATTGGGPATLNSASISVWLCASLVAAAVVACVLGSGIAIRRRAAKVPRGYLELSLQPNVGPVVPGQTLRWTAFFHDANGQEHSTMPGTLWHLTSTDPVSLPDAKASLTEWSPVIWVCRHEVLLVVAPSMTGTLTMHARYADQYGRWYDAYSMQGVRPGKPHVGNSK